MHDPSNSNEARQSGQVLRFRLRRGAAQLHPRGPATGLAKGPAGLIDDLTQYEEEDREVDYRRRMLMNIIAVVIVTLLVAVGVWLADTISGMQKVQDCTMQGRQNCAPIEAPASPSQQ
jgi:hypothetical protein